MAKSIHTQYPVIAAGVWHCCLKSIGHEYESPKEGDKSWCEHCGELFILIAGVWRPDWQVKSMRGH